MSSLYCLFSDFECRLWPLKAISVKVIQGKVPLFFKMFKMAFLCQTSRFWDPLASGPLCVPPVKIKCAAHAIHESNRWVDGFSWMGGSRNLHSCMKSSCARRSESRIFPQKYSVFHHHSSPIHAWLNTKIQLLRCFHQVALSIYQFLCAHAINDKHACHCR